MILQSMEIHMTHRDVVRVLLCLRALNSMHIDCVFHFHKQTSVLFSRCHVTILNKNDTNPANASDAGVYRTRVCVCVCECASPLFPAKSE